MLQQSLQQVSQLEPQLALQLRLLQFWAQPLLELAPQELVKLLQSAQEGPQVSPQQVVPQLATPHSELRPLALLAKSLSTTFWIEPVTLASRIAKHLIRHVTLFNFYVLGNL